MRAPFNITKMPIQDNENFVAEKNENFQMKIFDIFLIATQNIDCGYQVRTASMRRFEWVPIFYVWEQK